MAVGRFENPVGGGGRVLMQGLLNNGEGFASTPAKIWGDDPPSPSGSDGSENSMGGPKMFKVNSSIFFPKNSTHNTHEQNSVCHFI